MKYYTVTLDKSEVHIPEITNWNFEIEVLSFYRDRTWVIPFRNLLFVKAQKWDSRYLQILFSPFPLIHKSILHVFYAYGIKPIEKQMIFLDTAYGKAELYYLLLLFRVQTKIEKKAGSCVMKCKRREVMDRDAFYVIDGRNCLLVCSLAFVESLIREGVTGISLEEINMIWEEYTIQERRYHK